MITTLPNDFDADSYTAFGSYAPIYTEAKRHIFDCYPLDVARKVYFVLDAVAQHAGHNGMLYRLSYRRLMKIAHVRHEGVQQALLILIYDLGWLREHRTTLPGRSKPIVDWQLSPFVLYIAAPHIESALSLWRQSGVPDRKEVLSVSAGETQPESENQNQESRTKNQNHEPEPEPDQALKGKARFPERWREVSIEKCRDPLSGTQEQIARTIASTMKMHLTQARQAIQTYGSEKTMQMLTEVQKQMTRKNIARPGALLTTYLRNAYGVKD
jgi:hypothetical protein